MDIFAIIVMMVGVAMACSNFPQAFKIFKRKSAKDIAPITPIVITIGSAVWFAYGWYLFDWPLIISNGVGMISATAVIVGYALYR